MPGLKEIKRRITSVKSTKQITKAMKMVAAAKFRRAVGRIIQLRPYASKMHAVLSSMAKNVESGHPLLDVRIPKEGRGTGILFRQGIVRRLQLECHEERCQDH